MRHFMAAAILGLSATLAPTSLADDKQSAEKPVTIDPKDLRFFPTIVSPPSKALEERETWEAARSAKYSGKTVQFTGTPTFSTSTKSIISLAATIKHPTDPKAKPVIVTCKVWLAPGETITAKMQNQKLTVQGICRYRAIQGSRNPADMMIEDAKITKAQ